MNHSAIPSDQVVRPKFWQCALCLLCVSYSYGGDWPQWRFGAGRGAVSPHAIAPDLQLQWVRECPPSRSAWPSTQNKLQFDTAPEPVVEGQRIFIPSNTWDGISACDTRSGKELWRFDADGPVRFAPIAHKGKVYFVADDGFLYCLDAADGSLRWRVNGGPADRRILGNHRLISSWPARGGPVLHEGRLYFSASIWPFMGIFIHALDPESGEIIWSNSGDGSNYITQPHNTPSFAGIVPQGHFAAEGDRLVVPGGRSTPAIFDCRDGRQVAFPFDKKLGGHAVMAGGGSYFCAGTSYFLSDGKHTGEKAPALLDDETFIMPDTSRVIGISARPTESKAGRGQPKVARQAQFERPITSKVPGRWFIKAGNHIFAAGSGKVAAYDCSAKSTGAAVWEAEVPGTVWNMLAADDRLFVMTTDSRLYCFGAPPVDEPVTHTWNRQPLPVETAGDRALADAVIRHGGRAGYALALGKTPTSLIASLMESTEFHLVAVDDAAAAVAELRRSLQGAGLYGSRAAAHVGAPERFPFPPYLAHAIIVANPASAGIASPHFVHTVFAALRPYGGCAMLALSAAEHERFMDQVNTAKLPQALVTRDGGLTVLRRVGALPNTDDWSHQYGNSAQTVVSQDKQVRAPLGVLWFGGPTHEGILPRHGHGPNPQVAGGRLLIEGPDLLRAVDVYTGRVLWEKSLPGFGKYYNVTSHFAGAGKIGSNYVTLADHIYAVYDRKILELDAATGVTTKTFALPDHGNPHWGYIGVTGDLLVASAAPLALDPGKPGKPKAAKPAKDMRAIIEKGATWQYLAGEDPVPQWQSLDAALQGNWKRGKAGFGYGDDDDATRLDMRKKYTRVYIRHEFSGAATKDLKTLGLMLNFDDGFIAYLNGKEVARSHVQGHGSKAKTSGHEAGNFEYFEFKDWQRLVLPGRNVLALAGYNTSANSSDFSLDPYLVGLPEKPALQAAKEPRKASSWSPPEAQYASGSRRVCVFDRKSGTLLWSREAAFNFRHNNFCLSDDTVFCIDSMTPPKRAGMTWSGASPGRPATLYALNARTGEPRWQAENPFGTFLSYSKKHDLLLQAGSDYRDRASDENKKGMTAFRGRDGQVLWKNDLSYGGPCLLWKDKVLTNGRGGIALDIKTGEPTGWRYTRNYGCNTAIGSEHLLTFRSGAAGFYDMENLSGTGNLGGFKSSCTSNLIPANGVLSAPDYTRTCTCAYQNQTSLAMVHMPEAEFWTSGGAFAGKRIGINFGAPGDRRSPAGTLWLEHPSVGGNSEAVAVTVAGKSLAYFRQHASTIAKGELAWVRASGVSGAERIRMTIPKAIGAKSYTVRLLFGKPTSDGVFDVSLEDKVILTAFQPGSAIKEFTGIEISDGELQLDFSSTRGNAVLTGIELIAE
ncbi:MAG: outer membrane protein assembly factor BamB [Rhodothermales bacterium]|jgi:outer membrane protein assembly factor BamB